MVNDYVPPSFGVNGFNCPHCEAYSQQIWYDIIQAGRSLPQRRGMEMHQGSLDFLSISYCTKCEAYALWIDKKMIYPKSSTAPLPIEEMPHDVKEDFLEARNIVNESPRGASALLRLALQKLMVHLGEDGGNINSDIGNLVKKGLPVTIQQALDLLRVVGNESVHPGEMDLKDDNDIAISLFKILNVIVDLMIVQPKEIEELYDRLPTSKKEWIKNRDKK
jgi:hypothetical protein